MTANGRKKKENAAVAQKVLDLIPTREIRFLFDDPDCTDSSSDEDDDRFPIYRGLKRTVHEIVIFPLRPSSSSPLASTSKNAENVKRRRVPSSAPAAADNGRYKGVRQRRWGKWAAEIRDSIRGIRRWLGTYDTREEAAAAYQEASRQLQDEKLRLQLSSSHPPVSSDSSSITVSERTLSLPSPSSVLDVSGPAAAASVQAPPPPPSTTGKPTDVFWPPAVNDFLEERSIAELFELSSLEILPELNFSVADNNGDAFLVDDLGDNFDGINDLPLWAPNFDGDDLSFLDSWHSTEILQITP